MATNLDLNTTLIDEAVRLGRHKSKKEAVNTALAEYIRMRKRLGLIDLFGKITYADDYDHKAQRSRKKSRR